MAFVTRCPHCQKPVQVQDAFAGKQVQCGSCKQLFVAQAAPARQPVAAAAPVASFAPPTPPPAPQRSAEARPKASTAKVEQAQQPTGQVCPACKARLPAGATLCLDCGWVKADLDTTLDTGPQPVICTNPACGVANPPTERYCQRCNTMLPTAAGTTLHGRYQIERLLAIGGFGAVYLAKDAKTNQKVAIKDMICADANEFNIRLNFFRREAEILRAMEKIAIVPRFVDFIHQGQAAHLVMEYIPGQDLLKIMETNGSKPFPIDLIVEWGRQICDVLHLMHSQSPPIVHRDLKPDNLMLMADQRTIKMIDFGTARDVGRSLKTKLAAKTRVYTEGYAPPEQIIGKPEARSDLFALAGTMYHLATGHPPEGFYTARELEEQLKNGKNPSPPSEGGVGGVAPIPPEHRWFFELLKINLAEDANDRYFSAKELKTDLEKRRVTKEVPCPGCGQINKVREPYCSKCAQPLTDPTPPCNHCGKTNRMGSRCCIHCGNRLR
jgi:serine/threonine protein kinase/ribosomal protein L40E